MKHCSPCHLILFKFILAWCVKEALKEILLGRGVFETSFNLQSLTFFFRITRFGAVLQPCRSLTRKGENSRWIKSCDQHMRQPSSSSRPVMRCIFEEHIFTGGAKEGPHLNDFRVRTISFFFSSAIWHLASFMCGRRNGMVSEERLRGGMGNTYT